MNGRLKIGLIGFGFMGKTHYENSKKNPLIDIKMISSRPEDDIAAPTGVTLHDNWKAVIENKGIDAVIIATPTFTHKEIAVAAAKQKKHIFLEKPMALNVAQCNHIIKAAEENNVKLFIGHVLRFWPSYSTLKCQIEEDPSLIGDLKMVRLRRLSSFPNWSDWFIDKAKSGGVVLDLSIHDIDFACSLFGKLPKRVFCTTSDMVIKKTPVPAISCTTLDFDVGTAYCEASWAGIGNFPFTADGEIIGDEGLIDVSGNNEAPIRYHGKNSSESIDPYDNDGYYSELDSFAQCILNEMDPAVKGTDGRNAVAVCNAAIKSSKENRPVQLSEVLK